jgi:hypothetical protein
MKFPYIRGTRVRALKVVTEAGPGEPPDRSKTIKDNGGHFFPGYVHAEPGELGTVVETDYPQEVLDQDTGEAMSLDTVPTVRFDRTGTATIVGPDEIELVEPIELLGCEQCFAYYRSEDRKCWYGVEAAGPSHWCLEWSNREPSDDGIQWGKGPF